MMLFPKYGVSVLDGLLGSCLIGGATFFIGLYGPEHEEKRLVTEISAFYLTASIWD